MINSFRSEFADVALWAGGLPRPTLPVARPMLALVYAIGANWLTSSLLGGVVTVVFLFVEPPQLQLDPVVRQQLPVREVVPVLAAFVGVAVARAAGGRRAVALVAGLFGLTEAGSYAVQTWNCAHLGEIVPLDFCPTPSRFLMADLPRVGGGLVGLLGAPVIRGRVGRPSPSLVAAAVIPIVSVLVHLATVPIGPVRVETAIPITLVIEAVSLLMWLVVGVVAGRLGGGIRTLLVLALAIALPATFGIHQAIVSPVPDLRFWQIEPIAGSVAFVGALVVGWIVTERRLAVKVPTDN